jgi:hypothetical protein
MKTKEDAEFSSYGLTPIGGTTITDLVRQNGWIMILRNHIFMNYKDAKLDFIFWWRLE